MVLAAVLSTFKIFLDYPLSAFGYFKAKAKLFAFGCVISCFFNMAERQIQMTIILVCLYFKPVYTDLYVF